MRESFSDLQSRRGSHGNHAKGENHTSARVTVQQVLAIRRSPLSCEKLAQQYGLSRQAVYKIKARLSWKWLTDAGTVSKKQRRG